MSAVPVASAGQAAWRTRQLVAAMLTAGLLLAGVALVAAQSGPNAVDIDVTLALQRFKQPWFAAFMYWVSWFGYTPQNLVMPVIVAVLFAVRGFRLEVFWVIGSQLSFLVTNLLKDLVQRPRPSPELVGVLAPLSDPSFPSGHTVQYTTLFGCAFFLVYVLARSSTWRTVVLIMLAMPVVLVGPSRLYLGQHWLSDVVGGYAVATLLLVPYCYAYARTRLPSIRRARLSEPSADQVVGDGRSALASAER